MQPLILREGEPLGDVTLPPRVVDALTATDVLSAEADGGTWVLKAGTRVGVVNVAGQQIIIQPKVNINRIVFMMSYALRPKFWRNDVVRLKRAPDLVDSLAHAFTAFSRRALEQGVLKGYVTVEESLPVLRGRIRESEQLRRRFGRPIPLEVRYDDYSVDIAENQILLLAIERLLKVPKLARSHRAILQRLRIQLADVTLLPKGSPIPAWNRSRLNARYQPALVLAELILAGHSFEQRVGDVVMSGYLLNMAKIFEDFITVALREAFKRYRGSSRLQYKTFLDEEQLIDVRPDFVWLDRGAPGVVADAKYKAEKPSGFPNADFYQLLAYCTVLGLDEGHLIYARGNEVARMHHVRGSGIRVVTHTVDLEKEPDELLDEISALAGVLHRGHRVAQSCRWRDERPPHEE